MKKNIFKIFNFSIFIFIGLLTSAFADNIKVGFNVPIDDYIDFSNLEVISEITKGSIIFSVV